MSVTSGLMLGLAIGCSPEPEAPMVLREPAPKSMTLGPKQIIPLEPARKTEPENTFFDTASDSESAPAKKQVQQKERMGHITGLMDLDL